MFRKHGGGYENLRIARGDALIRAHSTSGNPEFDRAFDELTKPKWATIASFTDEELAEMLAAEPSSREGLIAASIMRSRETWRTPARWALIISGLSLSAAVAALARTF
jgi:hypothetical protein